MIRNLKYFEAGFWNWGILDGCFGDSRISPTDIDGCIERHGHKLLLETKMPGAKIPFGQQLTLESFVRDGATVIIVWGLKDSPQKIRVMTPHVTKDYEVATLETLRSIVAKWFAFADAGNQIGPIETARVLFRRKGQAFVAAMVAELVKLSDLERRFN